MTKEEILEKSREENKNQDVYDKETQRKASLIAVITASCLCLLIVIVNFVISHKLSFELLMVLCGMESVLFFIKFAKMGKLHELFVAILYGLGFVLFSALWFKNLIA